MNSRNTDSNFRKLMKNSQDTEIVSWAKSWAYTE